MILDRKEVDNSRKMIVIVLLRLKFFRIDFQSMKRAEKALNL